MDLPTFADAAVAVNERVLTFGEEAEVHEAVPLHGEPPVLGDLVQAIIGRVVVWGWLQDEGPASSGGDRETTAQKQGAGDDDVRRALHVEGRFFGLDARSDESLDTLWNAWRVIGPQQEIKFPLQEHYLRVSG